MPLAIHREKETQFSVRLTRNWFGDPTRKKRVVASHFFNFLTNLHFEGWRLKSRPKRTISTLQNANWSKNKKMASDDNFWGVYANAPVFGQAHRKLGFFFSVYRCKENLVFVGGRLVNAQSPLEFAKKSFRKVEKYTCKTLLN